MSDEPSGVIAQLILMAVAVTLWSGFLYGVWSLAHGWRP